MFHSGSNLATSWHLKKELSHVFVGIIMARLWLTPECRAKFGAWLAVKSAMNIQSKTQVGLGCLVAILLTDNTKIT